MANLYVDLTVLTTSHSGTSADPFSLEDWESHLNATTIGANVYNIRGDRFVSNPIRTINLNCKVVGSTYQAWNISAYGPWRLGSDGVGINIKGLGASLGSTTLTVKDAIIYKQYVGLEVGYINLYHVDVYNSWFDGTIYNSLDGPNVNSFINFKGCSFVSTNSNQKVQDSGILGDLKVKVTYTDCVFGHTKYFANDFGSFSASGDNCCFADSLSSVSGTISAFSFTNSVFDWGGLTNTPSYSADKDYFSYININNGITVSGTNSWTTYPTGMWGEFRYGIGAFYFDGTITDIDGNIYTEVTIGTQTWMVQNLRVTRYKDGTPIPYINASAVGSWPIDLNERYCWANNNNSNSATYGAIYSRAVAFSDNIAPEGWRVPSKEDFDKLAVYLGGETVAGGKLKETGTSHWASPNTSATNESGFSALPAGQVYYWGLSNFTSAAQFWTTTEETPGLAGYTYIAFILFDSDDLYRLGQFNHAGYSIRCIKNNQIYVNLDNSAPSSGNGKSTNPYNITQLYDYVTASAADYDTYNLKGYCTCAGTVSFWNTANDLISNHIIFKSWDELVYGPWMVSAGNVMAFSVDPNLLAIKDDIIIQDGIINNCASNFIVSNYKNMIFYGFYNTMSMTISANYYRGCSFINCPISIYDYDGTGPDHANSYLATNRFYDCVFYNSPITDNNSPSASNELTFQSCLFSGTSAANFANVLTSGSRLNINDCTFGWIPGNTFPAISEISVADKQNIASNLFNIPNTSATRSPSWVSGDYIYGAYNSVRNGPGVFYFETPVIEISGLGHIGAFYFGPIEDTISASILEISAVLLQPTVSALNSVSATIVSNMLAVSMNLLQPTIYAFQDIEVDFVGVPRAGSSPLTVDFTASVLFSPEIKGKYRVKEYTWCFDYDYTNGTCNIPWITTTQNPTTYVYTGYSGQTYSVKCCVKLELI